MSSAGGSIEGLRAIFRTVQGLDQSHRASQAQSVRNLQMTNAKASESTTEVINHAVQSQQIMASTKGKLIDVMA